MFWNTKPLDETPSEMAARLIAEEESLKIEDVFNLVGAAADLLIVPQAAPFLIAGAVIMSPLHNWDKTGKRREVAMPGVWFPHVLAEASADGRFFVGRVLETKKGAFSMADAMQFIAIEKEAPARTDPVLPKVDVYAAKRGLRDYYSANKSAFDKAMTAAGGAISTAAGVTLRAAGDAAKAIHHKLKVGF